MHLSEIRLYVTSQACSSLGITLQLLLSTEENYRIMLLSLSYQCRLSWLDSLEGAHSLRMSYKVACVF